MTDDIVYISLLTALFFIILIILILKLKKIEFLNTIIHTLQIEKASSSEKLNRITQIEYKYENLLEESITDKSKIVELETKISQQEKNSEEKIEILKDNAQRLKQEFQNIAHEILDNNSKKFAQQNESSLNNILKPVKSQLEDFKKKVEDVYDKESKDRSALQQELKTLKELNVKISVDAINLTNALKGQNKTQGSWGEMVLEKVLESSGLRKDKEYIREETLKNDNGKTYRPDVIVHLPENREVIIDAKTSLISYEQYTCSNNDEEKQVHLNRHIISINRHISELSEKKYEDLKGVNTLDFIFMFIPIESALMLALENDKTLFDNAFKKKIVLVSPTTLLIALKAVENSWRYKKQAQNTQEVVRLAEKLYTKVRSFIEDFDKMGKHIENAQNSYNEAYGKLSKGKDNIIRQIAIFKEKSNIKPKKEIQKELIDTAMIEIE